MREVMVEDYPNGSWFHHSFGAVYQIISKLYNNDRAGEAEFIAQCYDKENPFGSTCILE
jgi:hypothetical protein